MATRRKPGEQRPGTRKPNKGKIRKKAAQRRPAGKKVGTRKKTSGSRPAGPRRLPKNAKPLKVTPLGDDPLLEGLDESLGADLDLAPVGESPVDSSIRLNKFLAEAGVASRRHADELIQQGRVTINGEIVTELGRRVDPTVDDVRFDDQKLQKERPTYVLFNKPKGIVCTNAKNEQRKRVIDHLPMLKGRLFTVGRLDVDSEGLIVVTNDGELAQHMAHPRHGIAKTYSVIVKGTVDLAAVEKAQSGVWLSEGKTAGFKVRIDRKSRDRTYLRVSVREGKNREVRRVFARLGYNVLSLKRIRIGPLSLHGLGPGKWRFIKPGEVAQLMELGNQPNDF